MMRNENLSPHRRRRYWRITLASVVLMVITAMLLPLVGYLSSGFSVVSARDQNDQAQPANPRANYWRAVREGRVRITDDGVNRSYSAVTGRPMPGDDAVWLNREANNLINGSGQNWRQIRNRIVVVYGGWLLFGLVIVLILFYALRGRVALENGPADMRIPRWTAFERIVHWVTAGSFLILAVTGLSLLFGRLILIPLLGPAGFSTWAMMARDLHQSVGPWVFTPGIALMIGMWVTNNLPEKGDLEWWFKGGGIIGKSHPSSGRLNSGEKLWFWFIATFGVACIVTGIILAFPAWGQTRNTMQFSNLIHAVGALLWIGFWMGHAYIGTIGSQGSLQAMTTGYVDANWAKQHHDRWYEAVRDKAVPVPDQSGGAAATANPTTAEA